jgi:hypothetical protein
VKFGLDICFIETNFKVRQQENCLKLSQVSWNIFREKLAGIPIKENREIVDQLITLFQQW